MKFQDKELFGIDISYWFGIACIILTTCISIMFICEVGSRDKEIERLEEEKLDLEIALKDSEDEVYALELDLKNTNETLADTAYKLSQVKGDILDYDYVGEYTITAYCCEKYPHICGNGSGNTASGQPIQAGVTVAVGDTHKFPYGTVIYIEDVGVRIVQDTGNLASNQIDIAVDTHQNALEFKGQGKHKVYILEVEERSIKND